ncbi:S8 family serine peptidase [Pseudoxanthomonas sp. UTMC 1351]|uniref:S8 family serine peptidase n=1 Tax=Pseudoxanthomonas sp. UTMC 1351 TaxID=2695853 RepID=UPI0034CF5AC3
MNAWIRPLLSTFSLAFLIAAPAGAQLALPTVPTLPTDLPQRTLDSMQSSVNTVNQELAGLRELQVRTLLRDHPERVDTDPRGALVIRGEVVAIDPSPLSLQRARAAGFTVTQERTLDGLDIRLVVLRATTDERTRRALARLRKLDPDGLYDFNHLYTGSAAQSSAPASPPTARMAQGNSGAWRVGLIDTGVDRRHPALVGADIRTWGCDGVPHPDRHGTAVASLLVGTEKDTARTHASLFAADIYCGQPVGGTVVALVEALGWLAREWVPVINVSLVGPPNALLEKAIRSSLQRGHVIIAAVGNDGPAAPPLYPASYPDVIGVTAVDARHRALPEAGRGRQVDFAAIGAGLNAAVLGGKSESVRGTSYAAPLVARIAAQVAAEPQAGLTARIQQTLAAKAVDLGRRGSDTTYGYGLLGDDMSAAMPATANERSPTRTIGRE